ncbi:MAG TPA: hypothetical protein VEA37_10440, partial [Flavobacterium sp.]|nr:hypothetical protein [Flavobacterium sp.]
TAIVLVLSFLFIMCSGTKTNSSPRSKAFAERSRPEVQYKDDFRAASDKERTALLKDLNAAGAGYSVLIFTRNYKGEKVIVSNAQKQLHNGYVMSNLKTGIAGTVRIDNKLDTKVYDNFSKQEAIIEAKEAQKHKYIYLMKNPGAGNPFVITYSNTLRPLERFFVYLATIMNMRIKTSLRFTFIILSFLVSVSCSKLEVDSFIPVDYRYPVDSIGSGKIFYYRSSDLPGLPKTTLQKITESDRDYFIWTKYIGDRIIDSVKTNINGKIIEIYNYDLFKFGYPGVKGEIIKNEITGHTPHLKRYLDVKYTSKWPERIFHVEETEEYLRDTMFFQDGIEVQCMVTKIQKIITVQRHGKEIATENIEQKNYYARNKGLYWTDIESSNLSTSIYQVRVSDWDGAPVVKNQQRHGCI